MTATTFGRRNVAHRAPAAPALASPNAMLRISEPSASPATLPQDADAGRSADSSKGRNITIGALALIGLALLMVVLFVSDLRRDAGLQDTFRPDFNVKVERAKCTRYAFVVTNCSVSFSWQDGAGRNTSSSSVLVGFRSMGGLPVFAVRSAADPSVLTSSIAIETISNRIWTLVFAPGLCLLVGVLMLLKLRRPA